MGFFRPGAGHPEYLKMRDEPAASESAAWFEELWDFYEPLNPDRNFLESAADNLLSAWWQMYVAYCFAKHGHELDRPGGFGPDIRVLAPRPLWVEAICPEAGTGTDAAIRRPARHGFRLDRRAIILRYTAAVAEKSRQREGHVRGGVVAPDAPYVVAIGAAKISDADLVKDVPEILKALLGLGDVEYVVPLNGDQARSEMTFRREVVNRNETPIATDGFLSGAFRGISGVLFSPRTPWGKPPQPGREMMFVQNPTADTPVDPDWIRFGCGYRVVPSVDGFRVIRSGPIESG